MHAACTLPCGCHLVKTFKIFLWILNNLLFTHLTNMSQSQLVYACKMQEETDPLYWLEQEAKKRCILELRLSLHLCQIFSHLFLSSNQVLFLDLVENVRVDEYAHHSLSLVDLKKRIICLNIRWPWLYTKLLAPKRQHHHISDQWWS